LHHPGNIAGRIRTSPLTPLLEERGEERKNGLA